MNLSKDASQSSAVLNTDTLAVVIRDVPDGTIVAGNPAKRII